MRKVRDMYIETLAKMEEHGVPHRGGTIPVYFHDNGDGTHTIAYFDPEAATRQRTRKE